MACAQYYSLPPLIFLSIYGFVPSNLGQYTIFSLIGMHRYVFFCYTFVICFLCDSFRHMFSLLICFLRSYVFFVDIFL